MGHENEGHLEKLSKCLRNSIEYPGYTRDSVRTQRRNGKTLAKYAKECRRRKIEANFKKLNFFLQIISILSSLFYKIYIVFTVQLVLVNLNLALFLEIVFFFIFFLE